MSCDCTMCGGGATCKVCGADCGYEYSTAQAEGPLCKTCIYFVNRIEQLELKVGDDDDDDDE